jgi:acyl-CoA thioester hydrolase
MSLVTVTRVRVRYAETDQQGVAYHANYLVWMEVARTDLLAAAGFAYRRLERDGVFFSVAEAKCRYMGAARYDDEVEISTSVRNLRSRTVVFTYDLAVEGRSIAQGETTLVALDGARRPCRIPEDVAGALGGDA